MDAFDFARRGQVVGVAVERVLYFFSNQLHTGQDVQNESRDRHYGIAHAGGVDHGKNHDVVKDEFCQEHAVGEGDGRRLNSFAGPANVHEVGQFRLQVQQLIFR